MTAAMEAYGGGGEDGGGVGGENVIALEADVSSPCGNSRF